MPADATLERARRRNGLPVEPDPTTPLPRRLLTSPWTWASLGLGLIYLVGGLTTYLLLVREQETPEGPVSAANAAAVQQAFWYALPTLAAWVLVFLWIDRFRPQRLLVWTLTLGWGAFASTSIALEVNTWAGALLGVDGPGGQAVSAGRVSVFVAPFVEEAAKATILFAWAILVRYRLVSKLSGVALAGLAGVGFAFVENILYYSRAIAFGSRNITTGDVDAAITQLVWLRGFYTSFGHPLFTALTGIGLVIGVRSRSKVVRVLAPLVGFLTASLLHGAFNAASTLLDGSRLLFLYQVVALPFVASIAVYVVVQLLREGRLVRARLTDYVRMGWLPESDPEVFSRLRARLWSLLLSVRHGGFVETVRLQRAVTELAYLRDAVTRGIVDDGARIRERELLDDIRRWRGPAVDDPRGLHLFTRRRRGAKPAQFTPPMSGYGHDQAPLPPGVGPRFAPVDPSWGPPPR